MCGAENELHAFWQLLFKNKILSLSFHIKKTIIKKK